MAYLTPDEQREEWEARQIGTQGSGDHQSPYERAQSEGREADFSNYVAELYKTPENVSRAVQSGVNLYDPNTWGGSSGSGGGGSRQSVSGVPDDWLEDFLRRNPGDIHRAQAAYGSGGGAVSGKMPVPQQLPQSPWASTFSDPLTKQYEGLLQAQLALYQRQQAAMEQAAAAAEQRRAATGAAVDRLSGYVNERVGKLQGPAYTGTEQEVLRTQFLDPLERDRDAARKRALESISARGMELDSGVAQDLLRQVDQAFNEYRTRGQGAIATRQIEEQRSREQEAQQLLQYLAMLPDAVARGDLDFVAYVQSLIAQPGQQGLAVGKMAADLPTERLNDALRTLGVGGSGGNASAQMLQLLMNSQNQRQQQNALNAQAWGNIGLGFGL